MLYDEPINSHHPKDPLD